MNRSPIALALVAALGLGTVLPAAPALAQAAAGASATVVPIRTGSSSIGGAFGVRLSVYDGRSFELFWSRIPNAATYRLQTGGRTVQENGAISRFVGDVALSGGFDYTLTALDRTGSALAVQRFRVQPASGTQLVAVGGGTSAPTSPSAPAAPTTPANPSNPTAPATPPAAGTSPPTNLRVQIYSSTAAELFWQPGTFVDRNEIRRDGVLVATLGGGATRSYFDAARQPGRSYSYRVTAFNGAGPASATVGGTGGSGTPATPANPAAPANPMTPVAPSNPTTGPIRTGASTVAGDIPVRLAVYDARSYELFWERVPGAATYRLSRDGRVVQESNGLSRFVTGVDGAGSFAYALVALDRSGNAIRSTRFTVSPRGRTQLALGGPGTTPADPAAPANPATPATPPAAGGGPVRTGQTSLPGDLDVRLAVYDATSYELFWFRVPGAARYRLSRDGRVVQESDAVSHFVGDADATRRFAYTLEVLDRSGRVLRTRAFTVAPRGTPQLAAADGATGAPTTPAPANPASPTAPAAPTAPTSPAVPGQAQTLPPQVQARLATLFRVAGGDVLETAYAVAQRLDALAEAEGLNPISATVDANGVGRTRYACARGGTLERDRRFDPADGSVRVVLRAASCATGPLVVNGTFTGLRAVAPDAGLSTQAWSFEGYTLRDSRDGGTEASIASGTAIFPAEGAGALTDDGAYPVLRGTRVGLAAGRDASHSVAAFRLNTRDADAPGADGQAGLTFAADELRSSQIALAGVRTRAPFARDARSENYRSGSLRLTGSTGYVYDLNADNGDPATFQLDVTENGSTTSYTVPWSATFGFDRFDPNDVVLGF